jgi:hypothetical protein
MTDLAAVRAILETLVGFDTTSRNSNLALIEWVEAYLDGHGVPHRRVLSPDGTKSNLLATVGPAIEGWPSSPATPTWCRWTASPGPRTPSPSSSGTDGSTGAGPAT